MESEDLLDAPALHQPVFAHGQAASATLLGRLEDENHGAVELPGPCQVPCCTQEHGGVPVMPAGMHPSHMDRCVGNTFVS